MSNRVTAAHAVLPSGESVGEPMRLIAHSASTVNARVLPLPDRPAGDRAAPPERAIVDIVVRMSVRDSTSAGPLGAPLSRKDVPMTSMRYRRLGASGLKVS